MRQMTIHCHLSPRAVFADSLYPVALTMRWQTPRRVEHLNDAHLFHIYVALVVGDETPDRLRHIAPLVQIIRPDLRILLRLPTKPALQLEDCDLKT